MGPMKHIISMLPRDMMGGMDISSQQINQLTDFNKRIFIMSQSMTKKEKITPQLLTNNKGRVMRIARGSGLTVEAVQDCLKFFFSMKDALKMYKKFFV
jgi:signal recognition particle GTPase